MGPPAPSPEVIVVQGPDGTEAMRELDVDGGMEMERDAENKVLEALDKAIEEGHEPVVASRGVKKIKD